MQGSSAARASLRATDVGWWIRIMVLGGWALAIAASFSSIGEEPFRTEAAHAPFVAALTAVASGTAVVAWLRHRTDESRRTFLLTLAFGSLALLYAPHILLDADGSDPSHLVFGPISRAVFAVLLTAAVLARERGATRRASRRLLFAGVVVVSVTTDLVVHSDGLHDLWGDDPVSFIRRIEWVALVLSGFCAVILVQQWHRTARPLLATMAVAVGAMTVGSVLFLSTSPWTGRWWTAHLALGVCGVVLATGLAEEGLRRGRLGAALDLDVLPLIAEHIVEDLRDGLAVFDAGGALVGWNPAARQITRWTRMEAQQRIPPSGPEGVVDLGEGRWVHLRRLDVDRFGHTYRVIVFSDAADHVALAETSEELVRANEALRDFVAVAAHDIRSPLTIVRGMVEVLHNNPSETIDAQKAMFGAMRRAVERLTVLADDLLELSRLEAGAEEADISDVVVAELLGPQYPASDELVPDLDPELVVRCDPRHLDRMVANLVANATKYGAPPVELVAERRDDVIAIVVRDHGPGVGEDEVDQLFAPFARGMGTSGVGGSGLGLAIVQRLVTLNGGAVRYEAPPGGGAAFVLELPAARPDADSPAAPASTPREVHSRS